MAGRPMLEWVIDAAETSILLDKTIVATAADISNKPISELCSGKKIDVYVGSMDDVLDRYYRAALHIKPTIIVRLTGDCPLLTGSIIDDTIRTHLNGDYRYTVNEVDGVDVEVFGYDTLLRAHKLATDPQDREHVTRWIRNKYPAQITHFGKGEGILSVNTEEELGRVEKCLKNRRSYLTVL